jgi:hypothetical protein
LSVCSTTSCQLWGEVCPSAAAIEFSLVPRRFYPRFFCAMRSRRLVDAAKLDAISGIVNMSWPYM